MKGVTVDWTCGLAGRAKVLSERILERDKIIRLERWPYNIKKCLGEI
jgi:hypothetical protein